jgi:predicted DNA binding protein
MPTIVRGTIPTDEFALDDALNRLSTVEVEIERIVESSDGVMPLMWARDGDQESTLEAFGDDPSVQTIRLLAEFDDEQLYQMEWITNVELIIQMLTESDATILDAYGGGGRDNWHLRVLYPTQDSMTKTNDFCEKRGLTFTIESVRQLDEEPTGRYGLSSKQYTALRRAVEAGYYDVPHGTELDEIAADLGISSAALSERLHRATKALVEDTLLVGADPHD